MAKFMFALLILSMVIVNFGHKVNVIHKWKYCDYEWESQQQKKDAINCGTYDPHKCALYDIFKANDGRIFVTSPKEIGPGSPAALATVTNKTGPGGPLLRPYPDWSWHNSSCMCDGIVSVLKIYIKCNHIFVLDNGQIGSDQVCNPKLLIFDLRNDTLIETIYIPLDIATNKTGSGLLVMPFVYLPGKCKELLDKMIVFISDSKGSGLVVYDSSKKRMCRIESDYMKPTNNDFSIGSQNFTYVGGIFSMTSIGDDLYYNPVSGNEIYKIKMKTLLECPKKKKVNKQTNLAIKLKSQTLPIIGNENVIFYSDTREMTLLGTNVKKPNNTVILMQDDQKLQAVTGLNYSPHWDKLTYFASRYHLFLLGVVNVNETNFRYCEIDLTKIREETDLFSETKIVVS